jgi:chemotaxis protein methyltransferase CheR
MADMIVLSDREFLDFQRFIFDIAGISLTPAKKTLVSGRLAKRLQQHRLDSFGAYFALLASGRAPDEVQAAVDLLTTNETYFFREPGHFEQLRELATAARQRPGTFRAWSAACSSGEEPYSIAMVLAECLGGAAWEVLGTDISTRVLHAAATGHYPMERARHIPPAYLKRYCLKGIDTQQGTLLVARSLRQRVHFQHANLNRDLPRLGQFDVIFLRNVMIYFNDETKRQVVARILPLLKPGGHFYVGCSESLNDITDALAPLGPSSYRKK